MTSELPAPTFTDEKPPLKWVSRDALRPGDLLFSSSDMAGGLGWIIRLGRILDGVGYSHCGIFDGTAVIETTLRAGVDITPIDNALTRNSYTDIHRFLADDKDGELGDRKWPYQPVTTTARRYYKRKYSVSDAVLAAVLLITRKSLFASLPMAGRLREMLDTAVQYLHDLAKKDPPECHLTCSEHVYRSFNDAVPSHKYRIAVSERPYESLWLPALDGKQVDASELIEIPVYERMSFAHSILPPHGDGPATHPAIVNEILDSAAKFEALYAEASFGSRPVLVPSANDAGSTDALSIKFETVADYVSPGDLVRSHNTREIGRLRKPAGNR